MNMQPTRGGRQAAGQSDYSDFDDPVFEFDAAVRDMMQRNPSMDRTRAVAAVARKNPRLHQAYLLAVNPGRIQQRKLLEKFDLLQG